jgi:glycosyltransferase involved in cell wall biosynthesis
MTPSSVDVAILMPVYNGAAFLEEALSGVFRQTRTDWRLLVVDDASTDESPAILRRTSDPRVTVVTNSSNLGLYGTLARAVVTLDAEWIVIAMQDDRLHPSYLAEMARLVERHPAADGFWATEHLIDAAGARLETSGDTGRVNVIQPSAAGWAHALATGCLWTISGSFTRRRAFQDIPFRVDLPHCGDFDWFLRALRSRTFVHFDRPLFDLRLHQGQATARHMRAGQNLAEMYAVIDQQLRDHPGDMPLAGVARIGAYRAGQCARSVAGRLLRGEPAGSGRLAGTAARFLSLPWRAAIRRLADSTGVRVPAAQGGSDAGRR